MSESESTPHSENVKWVQSLLKRELPDFARRAVDILCSVYGAAYNCPWDWKRVDWTHASGVSVCARGDHATYDGDRLTRLVIAAHEHCVRISLSPGGPGALRVSLWPRQRDGRISERHPTIEAAIAAYRPKASAEEAPADV